MFDGASQNRGGNQTDLCLVSVGIPILAARAGVGQQRRDSQTCSRSSIGLHAWRCPAGACFVATLVNSIPLLLVDGEQMTILCAMSSAGSGVARAHDRHVPQGARTRPPGE